MEREKPELNDGQKIAENLARRSGYAGVFPPIIEPTPGSADEYLQSLDDAENGNHSSSKSIRLGIYALAFFNEIKPKDMARLGKLLLKISITQKNSDRARVRAVEAALQVLRDFGKHIPALERTRQTKLRSHLQELTIAYLESIGEEGFAQMGEILIKLSINTTNAYDRVRNISKVVGMITKTLEASIVFAHHEEAPMPKVNRKDPKVKAAKRQWDEMMEEVSRQAKRN